MEFEKTLAILGLCIFIEIINEKIGMLDSFFIIIFGTLLTFSLAELLDRLFRGVTGTQTWTFITSNLFFVYLLHDPLEQIVLRIFMRKEWLVFDWGCYLYIICRTVVVIIFTLYCGELITRCKKRIVSIIGK